MQSRLESRLARLERLAAGHTTPGQEVEYRVLHRLFEHVRQTGDSRGIAILTDVYVVTQENRALADDLDELARVVSVGGEWPSPVCLCRLAGATIEAADVKAFLELWNQWYEEAADAIEQRNGKRVCGARAGKRPAGGL